jgi:Flp pilus assembly protein TadG
MNWRKGSEGGQDLVEYALVLPLFLLLIVGTIEFSLLFFQYAMITNAAREGARAGVVMETPACAKACLEGKVEEAALAIMAGVDLDKLSIDPDLEDPAPGEIRQVRVVVRYETSLMTKMMIQKVGGSGDITLVATATMQREY